MKNRKPLGISHLFLANVLLGLFFAGHAHAQKISPDSAKAYIGDLIRELDAKHPGIYRYHSKTEFGLYVDSVKNSVTDSVTELGLYRVLKPVMSHIGCLHTGISLPKTYWDSLDKRPNLLPLQLYVKEDKAYIIQNFSNDSSLAPGTEIVRINGKTVPQMLGVLLPAIPSDGYNLSMKYRALYHSFPLWYRSMLEITETFEVEIRPAGKTRLHILPGKTRAELPFLEETVFPEPLAFDIRDSIGWLTVHTFSNSDIRRAKQRFKPFVDRAFRELKKHAIRHLVLDLRDNTGGSDDNAAYLARYFFDRPYRYWDRIEVTEAVAKEIKGLYRIFYRKPLQKGTAWLWQKAKTVSDFDYYELQKPVNEPYEGQVYVLINGFCMSSCSDFAAVVSSRPVVFFGEETGGGYGGNNSGMMPESVLAPSNLIITVPLQAYYTAVDTTRGFGHGTLPDYPVETTVDELIRNEDKTLNFVRAFIKNRKPAF